MSVNSQHFSKPPMLAAMLMCALFLSSCADDDFESDSAAGKPPTSDNTAPRVSITGPADGASFGEGTAIDFAASATDDEDGDLGASLNWNSNIDGDFGTGANVNAMLSVGVHTIIVSVTDSGGLSGNQQITLTITAPGDFVVYSAKQDGSSVNELYMVEYDNLGSSTKISAPLVSGGFVTQAYEISADGMQVVYLAAQDSADTIELYMVDLANPGVTTKLNSVLTAGGDVSRVALSNDGSLAIYFADQDADDVNELYTVSLANPGVTTKVNAPLVTGGDVFGFLLTADASQIVYYADQDTASVFELYKVDLTNPGLATRLNPALVAGGDIDVGWKLSTDGAKVLYVADQEVDNKNELYTVELANPGISTKLNPVLDPGRNVSTGFVQLSADGTRAFYRADQDTDDVVELYQVDLASPGVAIKLNANLAVGGDVSVFKLAADGDKVFYIAAQDTASVSELYAVNLANPTVSVKVNDVLIANGDVASDFQVTADGTQVVYRADQDTDNISELYLVDLASPGVATKVNPSLSGPSTALSFKLSADGMQVAYRANQDVDSLFELYSVDLASPGLSTKVNDMPLSGFGVDEFKLWP